MPRGNVFIQYGKVTVAGDSGNIGLNELEESLTRVLKAHGYPEEMNLDDYDDGGEKKDKANTINQTMEEIEKMARKVEDERQ